MKLDIYVIALNVDVEEIQTIDELLMFQNQLRVIDAGYQDLKLDTPERIIDKLTQVNSEIDHRVRSDLVRRLRAAEARRSALRTADEKRQALDAEIASLKDRIG